MNQSIIFIILTATPPMFPVVLNSVPTQTWSAGIYREYTIGEATFYDYQDGPTRSLNLTLLDKNSIVSISL